MSGSPKHEFQWRQLILSRREYERLQEAINDSITDDPRFAHLSPVQTPNRQPRLENPVAGHFRAATRLYLGTNYGLKAVQAILSRLLDRSHGLATAKPRKPLIGNTSRFAASIATTLFLHRLLYQISADLRRQVLREVDIHPSRQVPRLAAILKSNLTPPLLASLSGLAMSICPADQLRVTIAIYALVRAGELAFQAAEASGFKRPRWFGSWMLFALGQGLLEHSFVFNPDCFPTAYGDFILNHTPEYIQSRPNLPEHISWPTRRDYVDAIGEMAHFRWPNYTSPILRPKDLTTLPASINPIIAPITSRAHPAIENLSCALLHPSETSCFTPFIRQFLLSFKSIGKTFTLFYAALSLLRIKSAMKSPPKFLARLVAQILKVTLVISGGISTAWGFICFFNNYLPKKFMPESRFVLGGILGGTLAAIDQSPTGHGNNMYVTRLSIDTLWKVGVKKRWWKGIRGGDVLVMTAALATLNVLYDVKRSTFAKEQTMMVVKLLRGDIDIGLKNKDELKKEA